MGPPAAPYASAALTRVLNNAGSDLRYEALVALGYLGPEAAPQAAVAVAERATTDEDARLRRQALLTLTLFGPDAAHAAGGKDGKLWQVRVGWWDDEVGMPGKKAGISFGLRCSYCQSLPWWGHRCAGWKRGLAGYHILETFPTLIWRMWTIVWTLSVPLTKVHHARCIL